MCESLQVILILGNWCDFYFLECAPQTPHLQCWIFPCRGTKRLYFINCSAFRDRANYKKLCTLRYKCTQRCKRMPTCLKQQLLCVDVGVNTDLFLLPLSLYDDETPKKGLYATKGLLQNCISLPVCVLHLAFRQSCEFFWLHLWLVN